MLSLTQRTLPTRLRSSLLLADRYYGHPRSESEMQGTHLNDSYDDLKAYLKVLNFNKMVRKILIGDTEPFLKKARFESHTGQPYKLKFIIIIIYKRDVA